MSDIPLSHAGDSVQTGHSSYRAAQVALAVVWALLAAGLYWEQDWATWIWPWSDGHMTYVFLASIAAAISAPFVWTALVDEPAGIAGIALDGEVITTLAAIALLVMAISDSERRLLVYAAACVLFAIGLGVAFRTCHSLDWRDSTPQPRFLRVYFCVLVVLLVLVGGAMLLRLANPFPWQLPGHSSSIIGGIFVGAASYFAYGVWRNSWVHTGGQLAAFLAYGIVLAVPYWQTVFDRDKITAAGGYGSFPGAKSATAENELNERSLFTYTGVVTIAIVVACWYLFVVPETRIWRHIRR